MKIARIIAIAFSVAPLHALMADDAEPMAPWVTTSVNGDYLFKMIPPNMDHDPFGVAYKISDEGEFQEIWQTKGWYTFKGYLSNNGRYFVRFGPWASDQKEHTDLAIAFYDRGKLVKEYQVRELIRKPDLLEDSVSHYEWRPAIQTKPNGFYRGTFHLVMIDKTTYSFDYETGEIVIREKDQEAKSRREIWAENQAAANKRGQELLEASSFRGDFERHFKISGIEEMQGNYYGCSLEGKTWTADLTPKKTLKHDANVCVAFPVIDDERITASITPPEIVSAIESAFEHPFVAKRFRDGGATGIRLRTQGDRLHWNTPELQDFVEKITGEKPKGDQLRHWAYFIIDAKSPRYTSIYFNSKTREIILEDESKWPHVPYLIDATGNRTNASKAAHTNPLPQSESKSGGEE